MLGRYEMNPPEIHLVLNEFRKQAFDFSQPKLFWKLFAVYQHVL